MFARWGSAFALVGTQSQRLTLAPRAAPLAWLHGWQRMTSRPVANQSRLGRWPCLISSQDRGVWSTVRLVVAPHSHQGCIRSARARTVRYRES